jgi:hypothetical protein
MIQVFWVLGFGFRGSGFSQTAGGAGFLNSRNEISQNERFENNPER